VSSQPPTFDQTTLPGAMSRRGVILAGASLGVGLAALGLSGLVRAQRTVPVVAADARLRRAVPAAPRKASAAAGRAARSAADLPTRPDRAAAPERVVAPSYRTRGTWGGTAPAPNHDPMPRIGCLTVHHTGADTRSLGASDLQTVQRIEHYHRDVLGWACIGYHFLIGFDGTIYEGRPVAIQGAHVRDANRGNLGVALIGDCHRQAASPAQLTSLDYVLRSACRRYRFGPARVYGHRDLAPTTCPGDQLYRWLATWCTDQRSAGDGVMT